MKSIRRDLTLRLLGALGAVLMAGGVLVFVSVRTALTRQFDETLAARASSIMAFATWDGSHADVELPSQPVFVGGPAADAECFVLRTVPPDGLAGVVLRAVPPSAATNWSVADDTASIAFPFDAALPDGRPARALSITFRPALDEEFLESLTADQRLAATALAPRLHLAIARDRTGLDRSIRALATALLIVGMAVATGLVIAVRLSLARGLRPLDRLSADVHSIGADSLARRLDEHALPVELRAACVRLNELLQRLEEAFLRERRFSSAAAHELRTPITELRTLLEVSLSRPRAADQHRRSLEEALGITVQMERLIGVLLSLARRVPGAPGPVDPIPMLDRLRQRYGPEARARSGDICLSLQDAPGSTVIADPAMLEIVLDNLFANAVEYAAPRPIVNCAIHTDSANGHVRIEITNPADSLGPGAVSRLFEPFWRQSESRSDRAHLGLGLPLARHLAESMNGALDADLEQPRTLRVRLTLPRPAP